MSFPRFLAIAAAICFATERAQARVTPKDVCEKGQVGGCVNALEAPPFRLAAYEYCSTLLSIPPVTTTVATEYPTTTVATITPMTTTTETSTETVVQTSTITTTITVGPMRKRESEAKEIPARDLPAARAFPESILSSACSCIQSNIPLKTTSVTATSTVSVTATAATQTITQSVTTTTTTTTTKVATQTVAAACPVSPLSNGGFESGNLDGWDTSIFTDAWNNFAVVGSSGSYHLRTENYGKAGTHSDVFLHQVLKTCTGKVYDVTMRYYVEKLDDYTFINVMIRDFSHIFGIQLNTPQKAGLGTWVTASGSFTAREPETLLRIQLYLTGTLNNVFHVDDITVTKRA